MKCIFLWIFVVLSIKSYSQNTATVFGKITDNENEPIEDVSISILGSSQSSVFTNAKGEFNYTIPSNTDVTLVFYHLNFSQVQRTVKLSSGEKLDISKRLTSKELTIGVVEITSENRFKDVTSLDPINVTHIPTASQDFNAILFTLPGVSNRNE